MIVEEEKVEVIEEPKEKNTDAKESKNTKHILILFAIFFGVLIGILLIIFVIFTYFNLQKDTISKGIYINGIDVSNLSKKDAEQKISEFYNNVYKNDISLIHKDYKTYINPSEIELKFDIKSAVNYAYNIGKTGNIFTNNYTVFNAILNGINI